MKAPQQNARIGEQATADLSTRELAVLLRTPLADLYRAGELGLLPQPGPDGRWPQAAVIEIVHNWPQTAAAIEAARDLGATRSAELLARQTGLPVTAAHVTELATRGLLASPRSYKRQPMYRVRDLHALTADPAALALLTDITAAAARRSP